VLNKGARTRHAAGERPQVEEGVLQGLQEAHDDEGHAVQDWQGVSLCAGYAAQPRNCGTAHRHSGAHILISTIALLAGKRRYDRKQSGFGGQTKPVFHKKVRV
jgi:Ribosomal protein L44